MVDFCAALLEKNMLCSEYTSPEKTPFDDISGIPCPFKCLSRKIFLTKQEFLPLYFYSKSYLGLETEKRVNTPPTN